MKPTAGILMISSIFVCSVFAAKSQEPVKATTTTTTIQTENETKKAQNNNTVRSNRTNDKATVDPSGGAENSGSAASKKGYDYYKAKSDLNAVKTKDHNSSRSNKSSSANMNQNNADSTQMKINQNSSRSNNQK